ncbi:MAG TPA: hypothetical protein GXZ95_05140 [Mollicutes bacterium]|nr:hypothetical protein [Mollicutes bacterium]
MNFIKRITFLFLLILLFLPLHTRASNNIVDVYLFYGRECPHCAELEKAIEEIKKDYPNLKVHKYEVWYNSENRNYMNEAASILDTKVTGVPFTVIGTRFFSGYSAVVRKGEIKHTIETYSKVATYKDPVGEMLGITKRSGTLTYEDITKINDDDPSYILELPFVGPVKAKTVSLPVISIVMGAIDGFNPCAMWVLLFLISVLLNMKDRRRMWLLGSIFIITSAVIYLFFMLTSLNVVTFIGALWWFKLLIALIALIGGILNIRSFIKSKEDGCNVVDETKRKNIFHKIKKFTSQKKLSLAIAGIIALAITVNFIELSCSAGLPVIFTSILAMNNLSLFEYSFYIFLYILFFLLDDLIVFIIAMISLKLTGISNKYVKYSHLIGGIIMLAIGLLMIFKPEWLMFNF